MKTFYSLLLVVAMVACKKDDGPQVPVKDLLVKPTNGWIISSFTALDGSTGASVDVISQACKKDEVTIFNSNGTIRVDNVVKCNESESTIYAGTWKLSADDKTLTVTSPILSYTITIIKANTSEIEGSATVTAITGPVTATLIIKPK